MKNRTLIPLIVISILIVTFSLSVAFFSSLTEGKTENSIKLGELTFKYTENTLNGRGINLSMSVSNVEKMYNNLKEKGIKFFLDLETHNYRVDNKVYNDQEFLLQDPDGYLLRFND